MRSRYAAYAVGSPDTAAYVWRTWHPRTRPLEVTPDTEVRWTGLVVHDATGDEVEFTATFERLGTPGRLHERSVFARRAGRWFYLEATSDSTAS